MDEQPVDGAPDELTHRFTRNMSKRAADMLLEDRDLQRVHESSIAAARGRVVDEVRRLERTDEIMLPEALSPARVTPVSGA